MHSKIRTMYSTTAVLLVTVLCASASLTQAQGDIFKNDLYKGMEETAQTQIRTLRTDVETYGCEINLCFVLDGTLYITQDQFLQQQNFADLIIAITATDEPANFCAVHYNDFFTRISPRTPRVNRFLKKLYRAKQIVPQSGEVNVDRGFRYVVNQLLDRGKVANKVVFFSKGGRMFGKGPRNISRYFRANQGGLCGVVVGNEDPSFLQDIAPNSVVNFDGFFDLSEIIVSIVSDLCNIPCGLGALSC